MRATPGLAVSGLLYGMQGSAAILVLASLVLGPAALVFVAFTRTLLEEYRSSCDERSGSTQNLLRAEACLVRGDAGQAMILCRSGLAAARSRDLRARLGKVLAWAAVTLNDPFVAHSALLELPSEQLDTYLLAAYLACCNRADEAIALVQEARALGEHGPGTTKLLIDLLFRRGDARAIQALVSLDSTLLSEDERRTVEDALRRSSAEGDRALPSRARPP